MRSLVFFLKTSQAEYVEVDESTIERLKTNRCSADNQLQGKDKAMPCKKKQHDSGQFFFWS